MDCDTTPRSWLKCAACNRYGWQMAYQFVREPLTPENADALANACKTKREKLIIWTLLETGLRVSELCTLTPQNILWLYLNFSKSGSFQVLS